MFKITAKDWLKAVVSGANNLLNNKNRIDSLNVFPVPDGDTGTNMSSTIKSAIESADYSAKNISEISDNISRNMLLGARGNSGVILSQIFHGFNISFQKKIEVNDKDLISAFQNAKESAYSSVLKPVEGTILTVINDISIYLLKNKNKNYDVKSFWNEIVDTARKSCDNTQNLLPILKEVGVNDSGAEGLFLIFEGMKNYFEGAPIELSNEIQEMESFLSSAEIFDGEFGYCTEFIIDITKPKKFSKHDFVKKAEQMGKSIVVVVNDSLLKVHIHVLKPGIILNFAQKYGEFIKIKSENMSIQAQENRNNQRQIEGNKQKESVDLNPSGIISCNSGQGLINLMKDYGCDFIIESGQSDNPSAKDFIKAIEKVNSNNIIILPNNSNIIMAAEQAAQMSQKNVVVIPTKSQMEGITSIINFNNQIDFEENIEEIKDSYVTTKSGSITVAVRTTHINGVHVKKGEYIGIVGNKVMFSSNKIFTTAKKVIDAIISDNTEVVTIYYGQDSSEKDAKDIEEYISYKYDVDADIKNGGQPIYNFYISAEE